MYISYWPLSAMEVATRTAKSTSPTNFIKKSEFFCSSKSYMGKAGSRNLGFMKYVKKVKDIYVHVFLYNHGHWIGIGNIIGWARKIMHIFSELLDAFILHICKYILCIFSEWLDAFCVFCVYSQNDWMPGQIFQQADRDLD